MKRMAAGLVLLAGSVAWGQAPVTHFVHGQWFDGKEFRADDFYAEGGVLTHAPTTKAGVVTVDLAGGFVVPPYGDAHTHNFDSMEMAPAVGAQYVKDGILYVQGMTEVLEGSRAVAKAGLVNAPGTVDVAFAHGALTGKEGHPKEIYESMANGFYYPATEEQRKLVIGSHKQLGRAYWEIDSPAELEATWPKVLATKPDLIKIILSGSEHYTAESHQHPELGKGLDPALVPLITAKAHAAGLKVAAHVDTATDYHVAVAGGVDEIGHLPGYGINAKDDLTIFHLADEDIALTAKRGVKVQATAGIYVDEHLAAEDLAARRASQIDNLGRLKKAGVVVLVGSDRYGRDSVHEADYLEGLGVWSRLEMLRMWAVETPETVFPKRKIGELKPGYEASFLVLRGNPLERWAEVHDIRERWKRGVKLGGGQAGAATGD